MDVAKTGRKKTNRNVGHLDRDESKKNQNCLLKSIERNEKMVEEMQQQMLQIEKQIMEKKLVHEKAKSTLEYKLRWTDDGYFQSYGLKKMEIDKLTFTNNAYRDKKAVISFSSGEREINIHNLNRRILHEAHSMGGERRLLKMLNPKNDVHSGLSLKQVEEQNLIYRIIQAAHPCDGEIFLRKMLDPKKDFHSALSLNQVEEQMKDIHWSMGYHNIFSTSDEKKIKRRLKELEWERDRMFVNAPCKGSLWNSLPSTKKLHKQIQAMEAKDEEKRKMVLGRRKKIESKERKIKKVENEIKIMRNMLERICIRKQRVLGIISFEKSCLKKVAIL